MGRRKRWGMPCVFRGGPWDGWVTEVSRDVVRLEETQRPPLYIYVRKQGRYGLKSLKPDVSGRMVYTWRPDGESRRRREAVRHESLSLPRQGGVHA